MQKSGFSLSAIAMVLIGLAFSAPSAAQDDDDENVDGPEQKKWLIWESVERFRGQADIQGFGWIDRDDGVNKEQTRSNDTASISFELVREPQRVSEGTSIWAPVKVLVAGESSASQLSHSPTHRVSASSKSSFAQSLTDSPYPVLSLSHASGEFELLMPSQLDSPVTEYVERSEWRLMDKTVNNSYEETSDYIVSATFNGRASEDIGPLSATVQQTYVEEDGKAGHSKNGRVVLFPEYTDLTVVVEFDAYDDKGKKVAYEDWRPYGSIKAPGTPGNYIDVKAVLRPAAAVNKPTDMPKVKYFRFELLGTSREPGVTMNWPLDASDKDVDMRLKMDSASPGKPGKEWQSIEVTSPSKDTDGFPHAMARIDSLDFGGRTELRVVAELEDGRKIFGALQAGGLNYNEIRIPKRDYGEWVADAWRIKNNVEGLPDSDDEENDPVGDGDKGDGLTLYEEYRGFAVRRMKDGRVEGDPKRKDFFILNLIGSDAWPGLRLFEDATGLRVVHRLEKTEMSEVERIINGNHTDAPQRTTQHGVVLKTLTPAQMGGTGAATFPQQGALAGFAFKPKTTKVVAMPARNDPKADTNQPWNLKPDDIAMSYDLTLVHELLHSIGVAHHGEGDVAKAFRYIPSAYKDNRSGARQMWTNMALGTQAVDVRLESTGQLFVDMIGPALDMILDNLIRNYFAYPRIDTGIKFSGLDSASQWVFIQQLPSFDFQIGVETGQHSGNEQCPMRYNFAQIYLAKGLVRTPAGRQATRTITYYLILPGTDDIGVTICEAPEGTGINELDRKPQSRFGKAAAMRGNCLAQICPNDAYVNDKEGLRPRR